MEERSSEQPSSEKGVAEQKRSRRATAPRKRWPAILLAIALLVLVVVGVFSWDRWIRYDDAADVQGIWFVAGTDGAMAVDGEVIVLSSDVSYPYVLDPFAKTMTFSFGDLKGTGHYRFSADRSRLVIFDGDTSWWVVALFEDLAAHTGEAWALLQGYQPEAVLTGEGVTSLSRSPVEAT